MHEVMKLLHDARKDAEVEKVFLLCPLSRLFQTHYHAWKFRRRPTKPDAGERRYAAKRSDWYQRNLMAAKDAMMPSSQTDSNPFIGLYKVCLLSTSKVLTIAFPLNRELQNGQTTRFEYITNQKHDVFVKRKATLLSSPILALEKAWFTLHGSYRRVGGPSCL